MNKIIFLIIAPSGAGKTTIESILKRKYGLKSIQSYTTRQPRYEGEPGHIFVSEEEFDRLENKIAYTEFCNFRYCAIAKQVEECDLYVIDPQGVEYFRQHYKGDKQIRTIYINTKLSTRYERMLQREKDNGTPHIPAVEKALERISNDTIEFYDYIHKKVIPDFTVNNNDTDEIDDVADKVYEYIQENNR